MLPNKCQQKPGQNGLDVVGSRWVISSKLGQKIGSDVTHVLSRSTKLVWTYTLLLLIWTLRLWSNLFFRQRWKVKLWKSEFTGMSQELSSEEKKSLILNCLPDFLSLIKFELFSPKISFGLGSFLENCGETLLFLCCFGFVWFALGLREKLVTGFGAFSLANGGERIMSIMLRCDWVLAPSPLRRFTDALGTDSFRFRFLSGSET